MNQTVEPDFDELGVQLGRALRGHVASQSIRSIGLEPVLAGVRRRRARRRGGVMVVCFVLIAAAGVALTTRADESVVSNDDDAPIVRPAMLPAYATLDGAPGVGEPVAMYALRGGAPMGVTIPQVDVWQAGDQRLVIRSVDNREALPLPAVTTTVVATTAVSTEATEPWGERSVELVQVRGLDGAVEELATDQFAVWIPTSSPDRYTVVVARGMSRAQAFAAVESFVDIDDVLEPAQGFTLTERAHAQPASTLQSAYASITYGTGDTSAATWIPPVGHRTVETAWMMDAGRLETIAGRDVIVNDQTSGTSSATWLDSGGVMVSVWRPAPGVLDLVPFIHMVDEAAWVSRGEAMSTAIARELPAADDVSIGLTSLIRRGDDRHAALCLRVDATEACVADPSADAPASVANQVEIDGHWVIFGYRQILPEEESYLSADELRFASSSGSCCAVEAIRHNGAIWFVVQVDDDVDVIGTNVGQVFGGIVGSISRPLIASNI